MFNLLEEKEKLIQEFNPNNTSVEGSLFGLPFSPENASVIILPVPWEVTVSYKGGTSKAPEAILKASTQVDLFLPGIKDAWKLGIAMVPIQKSIIEENDELKIKASEYMESLTSEEEQKGDAFEDIPDEINEASERLNNLIKSQALKYLNEEKLVGILGGDHSTPLGLIKALSEKYDDFGILQIDAHADLREKYQEFEYSHASIMYNALKIPNINRLVQVGIRDFCEEEWNFIQNSDNRVSVFTNYKIKSGIFERRGWKDLSEEIIEQLPEHVYISFDIDGLDPKLCPGTGTPVPGGLDYEMADYLIRKLVATERKIIGFDLCEVGQDEWDSNVGARILFTLCCLMGLSHQKLQFTN